MQKKNNVDTIIGNVERFISMQFSLYYIIINDPI